jgi:hypothetical protein
MSGLINVCAFDRAIVELAEPFNFSRMRRRQRGNTAINLALQPLCLHGRNHVALLFIKGNAKRSVAFSAGRAVRRNSSPFTRELQSPLFY